METSAKVIKIITSSYNLMMLSTDILLLTLFLNILMIYNKISIFWRCYDFKKAHLFSILVPVQKRKYCGNLEDVIAILIIVSRLPL